MTNIHNSASAGSKLLTLVLSVLFVGLGLTSSAWTATYYVATTGNDSYNGLSLAFTTGANGPFRTLQRAAQAVRPGDTVRVRGGIYQEISSWSTDGTEAAPIILTNYGDETVVIDGANNTIPANEYGVLLSVKGDWYTVSNLEISYSGYYGMMVSGEHCTVDNISCHHSYAAGITTTGSFALVQNCRAWYNSKRREFNVDSKWSTGISIMGPAPYYSKIRKCVAWHNWGQGIKAALSYHATIEDCVSYDNMYNYYVRDSMYCLFQRNLSYNTPGSLMEQYGVKTATLLYGDETRTPQSSNNTFINNLFWGGTLYNVSIGSGTFENCLFANNTIVNASVTAPAICTVRIGSGAYSNARFENNIIVQDGTVKIIAYEASGVTFGHNDWSKLPSSNARAADDVIGDPQLLKTGPTDPGALTPGWFRISDTSPARDRAVVLNEVPEDFVGTMRGSLPDIGAFEVAGENAPLAASAAGSPATGQAPLAVNFTPNSTGGTPPYAFAWAFGDGSTSSIQNPSHTFTSAGTYLTTLSVTDDARATVSSTLTITVTADIPLSAEADASPASGQAPLAVSFASGASGGQAPYTYRWAFGDGGTSTAQNPAYTYNTAGSYTATLTVTDSASATATSAVSVAVTPPTPLSATATASPASGQAPLAVNFTAGAGGGRPPYAYRWTFGDGGTSTSPNPTHIYYNAGSYTANLSVTDAASTTAGATVDIAVAAPASLAANIVASPTSGPAPLTVNFAGSASGGASPYSWSWSFGDGGTSTAQNPSHVFVSPGNYTVALSVTDSSAVTAASTMTVIVTVPTVALSAKILASVTAGEAPLEVSFKGIANGGNAPYSYSWSFGDGATSTDQNPAHVYLTAGSYIAVLTITDGSSAKAPASMSIRVISGEKQSLSRGRKRGLIKN